MKILIVIPYYAPAWAFGGPVPAVESLAIALARRGHDVHVWSTDALNRSARLTSGESLEAGVHVRRFRTVGFRTLQHFNMFVTPGLLRAHDLCQFDVIHLHEFRTAQNAILLPLLGKLRKPFIVTPHGSFRRRGRVFFKVVYDILFGYRLVERARLLTALTQREAADIRAAGVESERIRILPNAVQSADASSTMSAEAARALLGMPSSAPLIVFMGRLHRIKGPDLLLDAFARIQRRCADAQLIYAGPDEGAGTGLRRTAATLGCSNRTHFLGQVDGPLKEAVYSAANVMVLPSRSEGLSMTLLEALVRAIPVVCTAACVFDTRIPELATVVGVDSEAVARGVVEVLEGAAAAQKRAIAGREYVHASFLPEPVARTAEGIYAEAIA